MAAAYLFSIIFRSSEINHYYIQAAAELGQVKHSLGLVELSCLVLGLLQKLCFVNYEYVLLTNLQLIVML